MSDGLLLIDKPPGVSSFRALTPVKRALNTKKVGHTGTLDPFATGLMLVLAGRATRLSQWLLSMPKRYEGVVKFGETTDTLDTEGAVIDTAPVPAPETILSNAQQFRGHIEQVPPVFSAIKIDGERSYRLARRGEPAPMPTRTVEIREIAVTHLRESEYAFSVLCSSGTYIRSLARDIAVAAGTVGYLKKLRRTMVGDYSVLNACQIDDLRPGVKLIPFHKIVESIPEIAPLVVSDDQVALIRHGRPINTIGLGSPGTGTYALTGSDGSVCALAEQQDSRWAYRWVIERS